MKLAIIVAMAKNYVIGINNSLPWYLSEDIQYFKRVTMGKPIIMGRKTFESIGRPLPGRTNVVITRNEDYRAEGVQVVHSLKVAMELCEPIAVIEGRDEVMVIGGAELYKQALPLANYLYLTEVHAEVFGDAFFPEFERTDWQEIARDNYKAVKPNPFDYSFTVLQRK